MVVRVMILMLVLGAAFAMLRVFLADLSMKGRGVSLDSLGDEGVLRGNSLDVARFRERSRRRRLWKLFLVLAPVCYFTTSRALSGDPVQLGLPALGPEEKMMAIMVVLVIFLGAAAIVPFMISGKSPHIRYAPSEINVTFDDVVGIGGVREEVVKTLNLFLAHQTFRDQMGGNPRRAILFEGPPGTGKTHMAKALAREAQVPYLFVSATAFQSQFYGATAKKLRSFFKELRKAAREEGGAIGFIEEIDAIGGSRRGMNDFAPAPAEVMGAHGMQVDRAGTTEGIAGVVNELLVQLQSFDAPTFGQKMQGGLIDFFNRFLPPHALIKKRPPTGSNILLIGATNRAADLDPALLRPGRFDRSIHFDVPSRSGRREIIDYYLDKKAHDPELDKPERRDQLASQTFGYSPVMIEHLFDEALIWALRDHRSSMVWADIQTAKLTEEIGLKQPVEYTNDEKRTIATHEAGHAVIAHLVGHDRKLEVLSIIKRKDALGLLAHSEKEERFTRTRTELMGSIQIAMGGMAAEEIFFGESGTGPSGDLAHATQIAAQMVGSFGMAGSLVSYAAIENGLFTNGIVSKVLANESSREAVERILDGAKEDVRKLLDTNRHLVVALRDELLEREELVGDEIIAVLREADQRHRMELV